MISDSAMHTPVFNVIGSLSIKLDNKAKITIPIEKDIILPGHTSPENARALYLAK